MDTFSIFLVSTLFSQTTVVSKNAFWDQKGYFEASLDAGKIRLYF